MLVGVNPIPAGPFAQRIPARGGPYGPPYYFQFYSSYRAHSWLILKLLIRRFRICNIITQYTFASADIRIRVHPYVKSRNQIHIRVFIAADEDIGILMHGYEYAN